MSFGGFLLYAAEPNPKETENTSLGNQGFVVSLSKIGRLILRKPSLLAFEREFSISENIWKILALVNPSERILSHTFLVV